MQASTPEINANKIKLEAIALGFEACGIASAQKLYKYEQSFVQWLNKGLNGTMAYMGNHIPERLDPRLLVDGARSVIVVALNYFPEKKQNPRCGHLVSKYAQGIDYHFVMKEKLRLLSEKLTQMAPGHQGRVFTDSAPVLERAWAVEAGIGWIGKNACLIIPRKGSFYFLGEIITNIELAPSGAFEKDHCGNCTRCIDTCPTQAIIAPKTIDARRCISYLTIEMKDRIPAAFRGKMNGRIFGCDICQDVCPHNRFAAPTNQKSFEPLPAIAQWGSRQWENIDKQQFNLMLKKQLSAMARIKFEKLKDNIEAATAAPEEQTG